MKVLAINGSPMKEQGNTAAILTPFLDGIREAGAEIELFNTKSLKINPCQGEFNCWFKTPSKCFQKDDMQMLLPKFSQADLWVFATPLYVDGMSGPMKNLLDRLIPLLEPFLELRDGHSRHPLRKGVKRGKLVLVSNCGLWEPENFEPLVAHVEAACKNLNREFAGAVLRPNGPILRAMAEMGAPADDVLEAVKNAGRQLVKEGRMKPETLEVVGRELIPLEMFIESANQHIKQMLDELEE
jgi:multimeric flavodoxin WrbA